MGIWSSVCPTWPPFSSWSRGGPVTELWLRDPSPRRWPWWIVLVSLLFIALPVVFLEVRWKHAGGAVRFWLIGATLGALPLGWAVANLRMLSWRCLVGCLLTAGLLGALVMGGTSTLVHHGFRLGARGGLGLVTDFLLYLPVCFVMEEVFFRGGLDSFVQRPGDRHYWWSAVLVSMLWGWWHLTVSGMKTWAGLAVLAVFFPLFPSAVRAVLLPVLAALRQPSGTCPGPCPDRQFSQRGDVMRGVTASPSRSNVAGS